MTGHCQCNHIEIILVFYHVAIILKPLPKQRPDNVSATVAISPRASLETPPEITPTDRLSMTLCLALILHGVIILGVTFAPEDDPPPRYESMEIVLVQQQSQSDDEAKVLAQASLDGGGEITEENSRPATPLPPPFPDNQPELAAPPPSEAQPAPAATEAVQQATPEARPPSEQLDQIAVENTEAEQAATEVAEAQPAPAPEAVKDEQTSKPEQRKRPSATALLTNSFKIAALSAEIKQKLKTKADRPKRKFVSASTREYKYAAYMEGWRAKVERVGNLNYPEEARRRNISGSLILDVALNPDGSVNQIVIRRSSGHKLLDDAAIRIVKLAAPFAPFPPAIRKDIDILHITRTWQFLNNRGFR